MRQRVHIFCVKTVVYEGTEGVVSPVFYNDKGRTKRCFVRPLFCYLN